MPEYPSSGGGVGALGTAATHAYEDFDPAGAAAAAQAAAIAGSAQRASNLSDLASAATARTNLGLRSAAVANKVAAGAAGVLDATDPTLTNPRTPTAHAASHVAAGTDPLTLTEAQITGLVADLAAAERVANKGVANGYAQLDGTGKIPTAQLPAMVMNTVWAGVASQAAMLALAAEPGDVAVRTDQSVNYMLASLPASTLANWVPLADAASPVSSVAGKTGAVSLVEGDITNLSADLGARALAATRVIAGAGLSGGGDLSTDRTLSLPDVGPGAGTTGDATHSLSLTLDVKGRVVAVTANPVTPAGIGARPVRVLVSKTAAYTANADEVVLCDASGGAFTVTLPGAATSRSVFIKKIDASANAVTVSPASGNIDGAATFAIADDMTSIEVISDGTNWWVL